MESTSLVELSKKFNDSSDKLNELIKNLTSLNSTLQKMDKNVSTMSEFKEVLIKNNLVEDLQTIIIKTDVQYKEFHSNVSKISNYIEGFSEIKDTLSQEIKNTVENFSKVKNTITEFRKDIYPSIDDIKKYLNQLNAHNYTEISNNILKALSTLHKTLLEENSKVSSHIKTIEEDYLKSIKGIKDMYENYTRKIDETNKILFTQYDGLENKLTNVINSYNTISKSVELISEKNEKSLEYFYELCNNWAEKSVKKLALKKK